MKKLLSLGLVAVVATATTQTAQAQASANLGASATVAAALSASVVQSLAFGTVIPNFTRTVLVTDPTAGIVQFTGGLNAEVNVTFPTLPATLSDGVNTLPIGTYSAAHSLTQAGAQTGFAPAGGATTRLDAGTGLLFVHVGATVSPAAAQVAGLYSGTIVVQAAYTGN